MLVCLALAVPTLALASPLISQGYQASEQLAVGSIVSLNNTSSSVVTSANLENAGNLLGVVVASDNSLLSISNGEKNQVQVVTTGVVQVLVSNYNGDIQVGDPVTASPLSGIGMKATSNVKIVGVAQAKLSDSAGKSNQTVTDKTGKKVQVQLGVIPVQVSVAYYFKEPDKTLIPASLQNLANAIAGKKISPLPIIVSLVIFFVAVVSIMVLIYSAIRSSIISVGRNPLSQSAVYRSLLQVSALVLTILGAAVAVIYLILTKL